MPHSSQVATALLGPDRRRTGVSVGVAVALFFVSLLGSSIAESRGLTNDWFARFPLVVLGFLLGIVAVAVVTAYWNSGLVSSWLVAFAPTVAWLWTVLVGEKTPFPEGVGAPIGLALAVAIPLGTIGYAVGRSLRLRTQDGTDAVPEPVLRVLLGDEPDRVVWWSVLAIALFLATALLVSLATLDAVRSVVPIISNGGLSAPFLLGPVAIPAWLALSGWPAYRGNGLLASWVVLFGPFFGAWLTDDVLFGRLTGSGLVVDAVLVLLGSVLLAVLLGTTGYVLGTALRRATERGEHAG